MAARIVAAHKGKVGAANSPEGGAVFTFVLPVEPQAAEAGE
jgi:signal transduction histidine kinase